MGRYTEDGHWNYNDLSKKEKLAYDKKEAMFHSLEMDKLTLEKLWSDGISSSEYQSKLDVINKKQDLVLKGDYSFLKQNKKDFKSQKAKGENKMSEKKKYTGSVVYEPKKKKVSNKPKYKLIRSSKADDGSVTDYLRRQYSTKNFDVDSVKTVFKEKGKLNRVMFDNEYSKKK